jgi:hypothetical protein
MSGSARMNEFTGPGVNATPKTSKMALLVFLILEKGGKKGKSKKGKKLKIP